MAAGGISASEVIAILKEKLIKIHLLVVESELFNISALEVG